MRHPWILPLCLMAAAIHPGRSHASDTCPQFFPGAQPPPLTNPKLGQRTTLLCNDAYVVLAFGVTHGAIWSTEHPTAASLGQAHGIRREGRFHADDRLPPADQAQLADYRRSGYDRIS